MLEHQTETMTSIPRSMNLVDIDNVIDSFNQWQKYTSDVEREKGNFIEQLASVKQLLMESEDRGKVLKQESQEMKSTVDKLYLMLNQRCDLEDENVKLQEEIKDLNNKLKELAMENECKMTSYQAEMKDLQEQHMAKLDQLKQELNEHAEKDQDELKKLLDRKQDEIHGLREQLREVEKEKQAEIIKLTLEYDSKFLKMQKQNAHLQTTQASSSHQDLFRKKLMHAKEESNREITSLKRTISDLQQRLQQRSGNNGPSNTKRLKRF